MEDIIDALREANIETAIPLELPEDDLLVEIEEELLLPIPHDLRTFLLEASDVICGALEPVTAADSRSHTYLPEVTARAWSEGLSRELMVVCEYNGGYAHISQDGKVGFWSVAEGDAGKEWETLWHWIQEEWLV